MEYNIVSEYIEFVRNSFLAFFKIVLGRRYKRSLVLLFIDKYIDVRYYKGQDSLKLETKIGCFPDH